MIGETNMKTKINTTRIQTQNVNVKGKNIMRKPNTIIQGTKISFITNIFYY